MKTITTQKLIELAKNQDPESELYKMSYADISAIKEKIEKIIWKEDLFFSILKRLRTYVMICEERLRYQEVRKIEGFTSMEEILSYVDQAEKPGSVTVSV